MKTSTLSSILLMGALAVTGWQVGSVEAGGAQFGFQSSFSGKTGFQGRIGSGRVGSGRVGFQSNLQRRIRGQQGFHNNSRGSVNRRSGVSPLRQRLDAHTRKMQKNLFDNRSGLQDRSGRDDRSGFQDRTRFGKRHPDFDLQRKRRGHSPHGHFKGSGFQHPRHGGFGKQPRGRVPGPVLFAGPFRRFVLPPGFGVFQPLFGVSTNVTAFPGRSDFSQRILDKTQGIAFKSNFRDQNAWTHLDAEAFGGRDDVLNKQSPPRSHHYLKRMKDGKQVFSDYGGRVIGHGKSGPQAPPSPFSLR
ncbi:hypothetical protein [Nitrospina watsonii]|uniref:Uncharacterized protein n=1 Tax=Nitrospina watsonii TaxID=1323948 RepID=A0ABM9HAX0_9BACT|nr:hypothetical protein [Nitrospina watsonii]CAI2717270.1 protein of unknown function [Nitrospina watsonii]